jgi:hypothetical protein
MILQYEMIEQLNLKVEICPQDQTRGDKGGYNEIKKKSRLAYWLDKCIKRARKWLKAPQRLGIVIDP